MDFAYSHDQSVTLNFKEQFSNDLMKLHPKFHPQSTHKDRVMTGLKIQFCPGGSRRSGVLSGAGVFGSPKLLRWKASLNISEFHLLMLVTQINMNFILCSPLRISRSACAQCSDTYCVQISANKKDTFFQASERSGSVLSFDGDRGCGRIILPNRRPRGLPPQRWL